ncbi:MAG: hypothetical protein V4599_09965 [Verrucomicrobiota bacterium]
MRSLLSCLLLLGAGLECRGEEELAPRAELWISPSEILCANLIQAIQERPDLMVMRLEDALVINEACAGEIVTAAMDAVRAQPALVQQIVETALNVAPSRSAVVMNAVRSYIPASERVVMLEEVRRAEVPLVETLFEVRRAEVAHSSQPLAIEEVRRAEVPVLRAIEMETSSTAAGESIEEEIRRPEITLMAHPQS